MKRRPISIAFERHLYPEGFFGIWHSVACSGLACVKRIIGSDAT